MNDEMHFKHNNSLFYLFVYTNDIYCFRNLIDLFIFKANIIILGQGCAIGWISPSIPILLSDRSPLLNGPISNAESSWIASTSSIGAAIGTIFFGLICNLVGSKNSTMLCAIPLSVSAFRVLNYFVRFENHS